MSARIDSGVASGTFTLDGETFDVENNIWVVGDDEECIVIDAPHDLAAIAEVVGPRRVLAVLCTHAHDDHVRRAPDAGQRFGAPTRLHHDDLALWATVHPDSSPNSLLEDGEVIAVGGEELHVLHTPGHSPGSVCFYAPGLATVFTGDTLFAGGPGATGRSYSSFPTIIESIRERLLALPPATTVLTGHGGSTTIGDEAPHLQEWIDRGR
ncbi:MBL fold metallo-hydrolase [Quadrisphaera sp. DSM 44207]|uniref:MBL fold metallo-hydrolase n=1 Tax=Quadrisphaera sp. DSM 44207 TaxID=1881057 RepID=UPI000882E064|nr:MBL fold metallo-hydrolase [Quadrisphaera sp. DSM 44207]SDQ62194.1 hydroxyacylglutathione hydrolase [Quadrisphaera sp. DSM 44207]